MYPEIVANLRDLQETQGVTIGQHSVAIARLEERDQARDQAIGRIDSNVTWTLRGLVLTLLTVIGELLLLLFKKG